MKKLHLALVSALALSLAGSGSALAKPPAEKHQTNHSNKGQDKRQGKISVETVKNDDGNEVKSNGIKKTGLENALDHVKNPTARAAIQRAMERQKAKKEDQEKPQTDQQIAAADAAKLQIGFAAGDTLNSVTQSLNLPATGKYGSTIVWTSSNTAVISSDGKTVVRPTDADVKIVLTAVVTKNGVSVTKTFELTVKVKFTDAQIVAADKAALAIGFSGQDTVTSVTYALSLPATGAQGSHIAWVSSDPGIISNDGKTVNRPLNGQGDAVVTLTATLSSNGVTDTKAFTLIVKQQLTDAEKAAADKAALQFGFGGTDNASSVTLKLSLPSLGLNGSVILWYSSNPETVKSDGTVIRPAAGTGDKTATLTAVLVNNAAFDTKAFTVTVKQLP
ncbi:immunoglobulin-like domain-containing protein [Cohnella candidum]|uniref:Atrophied bacterial Ig domain-containing protein n=1 Tax=Cohnella candidum TaxID=2674991 RepID=A0A3G3JYL3_9BACL|nr:immunoglobulin-like domain-containing protein [Cohnella candidum]AYQ73346.1 hypothetical protein EAV92_12655 [Cohnella candidum]